MCHETRKARAPKPLEERAAAHAASSVSLTDNEIFAIKVDGRQMKIGKPEQAKRTNLQPGLPVSTVFSGSTPFYLYDRCTRKHTTHIHTETQKTLFFIFSRRDTLRTISFPLRLSTFIPFSLPKALFGRTRNRATCNWPVLRDYSRGADRCIAPVPGLLSNSLSLRAPTITLSHRRPEQKGKSMKEKYDASARKSAFMLASWSTVPRFHFDEHIRVSVRVCVRAALPKISRVRYRRKTGSPNFVFVDRDKENEGSEVYGGYDVNVRVYVRVRVCVYVCV